MVVVYLAACGGDDASGVPDAPEADAPGATCPLVGRWVMTSVFCNTTDVTADVRSTGGLTEMRIDFTTDATGPCHMAGTFTGPTCVEVEEHEASLQGDQLTVALGGGITSCQPAACKFNMNDAACANGDRANTGTGLTTAMVTGSMMVVTNRPPEGVCQRFAQNTITTYVKN
jgi:hypothetical protein